MADVHMQYVCKYAMCMCCTCKMGMIASNAIIQWKSGHPGPQPPKGSTRLAWPHHRSLGGVVRVHACLSPVPQVRAARDVPLEERTQADGGERPRALLWPSSPHKSARTEERGTAAEVQHRFCFDGDHRSPGNIIVGGAH